MGSLNDYKMVANWSLKYGRVLLPDSELDDLQLRRLGFYILVIGAVTGMKDVDDIRESIIDTDFRRFVEDDTSDDEGMDAVVIDEETRTVHLFNFKYRESYSGKGQQLNDVVGSIRFLLRIENEDTQSLSGKTKIKADAILEKLKSNELWSMKLYMVSNDNKAITADHTFIQQIKNKFDLDVESLVLDDIISNVSRGTLNASAEVLIGNEAVITFEESELSSSKSYLLRVSVADIIRLTSSLPELRSNYELKDMNELKTAELDMGLLSQNVRGYLGNKNYNANIVETIINSPSRFFMYNNGLTLTAKSIVAIPTNGNKKLHVRFEDFQIVNGGQTLRSLYAVKDSSFDEESLVSANVLIRAFQTGGDEALTNSIAEYTNSQNAISISDLKSVSSLQVSIEEFLRASDIKYNRKRGDVGIDEKVDYKYYLSMERLAQILYAKLGHPDKASNQKKKLFSKYYDDIFNEDMNFSDVVDYIEEYELIKKAYANRPDNYEQKYFYILYLNNFSKDIDSNIDFLDKTLSEYKSGENPPVPSTRKLIQKGFKELIDSRLASKDATI